MIASAPAPARVWLPRIALVSLSLCAIGAFAMGGAGLDRSGLAALVGVALLPAIARYARGPVALVFLPILVLIPPFGGVWRVFDFVVPVLAAAAFLITVRHGGREAWEVHGPGLLVLALLLAPLPGLLRVEVPVSFIGMYREFVSYGVIFLAIRRLISREESLMLLWAFPVLGLVIAGQLLFKVEGVGALIGRVGFRNFYTDLGWGRSNAVAAVLLVCICGTTLLAAIERRWSLRVGLVGVLGVLVHAILIPSSRSAIAALGLYLVILLLRLGSGFRIGALFLGAVIVFGGLSESSVRLLVTRFTSPQEYASWTERESLWNSAWQRFLDSPLIGIGLNQGKYQGDLMGDARAHSLLLDTLMEQGVLGGIVIVGIFLAAVRLCLRVRPTGDARKDRALQSLSLAMLLAIVTQSLAEPTLLAYPVTLPFLWFLAWLTLQDSSHRVAESA